MRALSLSDPAFLGRTVAVGPPTLVQSGTGGRAAGNGPATSTLGVAATAGNTLIAVCSLVGGASPGFVAAPAGFTLDLPVTGTFGGRLSIYRKIAAGGETAAAITGSGTGPAATDIELMEFAGLPSAAPDTSNTNLGGASATSGTTNATAVLAHANEIVIAAFGTSSNITGSEAITGFTLVNHRSGVLNGLVCGYQIPAATTAINAAGAWAPASAWCAAIQAYK